MVQALHSRDVGTVYWVCWALALPPFHSGFIIIVIGAVSPVGCVVVGSELRPSYIVVGEGISEVSTENFFMFFKAFLLLPRKSLFSEVPVCGNSVVIHIEQM
jgi:hypothetical protein